MIVPNVPVVAVSATGSAVGAKTTNVSLRVDDEQAAKLAFASDNGKLWLSLRPSVGARAAKPTIVTASTLLLGVQPMTVIHSLGGRG